MFRRPGIRRAVFRRRMAFGGDWYPADRDACARAIRRFQEERDGTLKPARWGVVPHAGWVFSGALAARVFDSLPAPEEVQLVIVLGGHLRPDDPVIAMTEGEWETPFGALPLHGGIRKVLEQARPSLRVVFEDAQRHHADNSTELQLPFVKHRYPKAELVVMRLPPSPAALQVGRLLVDYLELSGLRAVGVGSTDLTHYGPAYGFEPHGRGEAALHWVRGKNDPAFIDAIASGSGERILSVAAEKRNACSAGAAAALTLLAAADGGVFEPLDYMTSADIMPRESLNFVGYVGGVYA